MVRDNHLLYKVGTPGWASHACACNRAVDKTNQMNKQNKGKLGCPGGGYIWGVNSSHSTWTAFFLASL